MSADYIRLTADTMEILPKEKQLEVYDFAKFLETASKNSTTRKKNKKGSVLRLVGIGASNIGDIALNHDKYLYEI